MRHPKFAISRWATGAMIMIETAGAAPITSDSRSPRRALNQDEMRWAKATGPATASLNPSTA